MKTVAELCMEIELGLHVCSDIVGGEYDGMKSYIFRDDSNGLVMFITAAPDECAYYILDEQPTLDRIISFWDLATSPGGWRIERVPDDLMAHYHHSVDNWRKYEKPESLRATYAKDHGYIEMEDGTFIDPT